VLRPTKIEALPVCPVAQLVEYIPATAAVTWEVYYPEGLSKSYNQVQNYGAPLQGVLSFINAMSNY